jgi:hypothetical protein
LKHSNIDGVGDLSPEGRAALGIYRALICIADSDASACWSFLTADQRAEALAVLDGVIEKLLTLSMQEQLARIVRTAPGRRRP